MAGFAALIASVQAGPVAEIGDFFAEKWSMMRVAWQRGEPELYGTGYAWHVPWAYDRATRARLNDTTWGGGFGRVAINPQGDRHSIFFVAFADSHRVPQFILSYAWQRYRPLNHDWSLGWGYMAFLFSRQDVANYFPLPAALPCVSLRYRRWEAIGLFVPHVSKDIKGDVFYVFMRVGL